MRVFLDALNSNIVVLERNGTVSFANRAMHEWCGLKDGDMVGRSCGELVRKCPFLSEEALCPRDEVFSRGLPVTRRHAFTDPEGWPRVIEVEAIPLKNGGGDVLRMMEVIRDVTEPLRVEDLLERSAEGMTVLNEVSSVFLSSRGFDDSLQKALSLIGDYYSADFLQVAVPDDSGCRFEVVAGHGWQRSGPEEGSFEISNDFMEGHCFLEKCPAIVTDYGAKDAFRRTPRYEEHGVLSGISVPMVADDRVLGVLSILYRRPRAIDTAELWYLNVVANALAVYIQKERSLQKVEESEGFLHSILEAIGEGVVVVDRELNVISANKAFLDMAGMTLDDVQGKRCYKVSHGRDVPCYEAGEVCTVRGVFETGRRVSALHTHVTKEGGQIFVQTHAYPITDNAGRVMAAVETIADVTERVKLEKDLEKRVKELEEFYEMAVGRELRMIELKDEIAKLREELMEKGSR